MKTETLSMLALMMGGLSLAQAAPTAQSPATTAAPQAAAAAPYSFCQSLPDWFKFFDAKRDHAENPYIQSFSMKLRGQYQVSALDPAGGGDRVMGGKQGNGRRDNSEWRRFRIGAEAKVLKHFTLYSNWNIGGLDAREKYNSASNTWDRSSTAALLDEMFIRADFKPVLITLGKHKPAFIGEYRTSSAKIKTMERSALVNQLTAEKLYGLSVKNSDKKAKFGWEAGVWMNGVDSDNSWALPCFNSSDGATLGASLSYATGEHSRLYLDYMHSFTKMDSLGQLGHSSQGSYEGAGARDVLALTWEGKKDKFDYMVEGMAGFDVLGADAKKSKDAQNVYGLTIMPSYHLTPHFEAVFRYQLAAGSNAVVDDKRYYSTNSSYSAVSDLSQGFYLGLNYYVCPKSPDTLKLMTGIEYKNSHGRDAAGNKGFTGWSYSSGIRFNF